MAPAGQPSLQPGGMTSCTQLLADFDQRVAQARAALERTSDEAFLKPWSPLRAGQTLMTMPKIAVLRSFVLNHLIHHRAQLGAYLRLNGIPVPSVYGPSADEGSLYGAPRRSPSCALRRA